MQPEALDPAQQHAGAQPVAAVEVEQRVGHEGVAGALALAEVRRELQRLDVHQPTARPRATASRPAARLRTTFSAAPRPSPSSTRRWVSSIQVEKVVYEPSVAVPASTRASPLSARPATRPRRNAPLRLTASVPTGRLPAKR